MKLKLLVFQAFLLCSAFLYSQTVSYDIPIGSTVGLDQTSGDVCTAPWATEEAKQSSIGNAWGCTWTSTNGGTATSIQIELAFTVSDGVTPHPTTLNGSANNNVDPGAAVNCGAGNLLTWNIDPSNYVSMGVNTFMVDYTSSSIINQLDNLPYVGDPYLRVTVTYAGVGLEEMEPAKSELLKITDLMGREVLESPNKPLLHHYSDGTVRRVFKLD